MFWCVPDWATGTPRSQQRGGMVWGSSRRWRPVGCFCSIDTEHQGSISHWESLWPWTRMNSILWLLRCWCRSPRAETHGVACVVTPSLRPSVQVDTDYLHRAGHSKSNPNSAIQDSLISICPPLINETLTCQNHSELRIKRWKLVTHTIYTYECLLF